jgi:hypothetical protein
MEILSFSFAPPYLRTVTTDVGTAATDGTTVEQKLLRGHHGE